MKILFITDRYPPYYEGGYEINCEITAKTLQRKGHEIFILTSDYGIDRPQINSNVYRLLHSLKRQANKGFHRRMAEVGNALSARKNFRITKKVVDEIKPDIAYIWRMGSISIFPLCAIQSFGLPMVYSLGDYWLLEYDTDFKEKNLLKRAYRYLIHGGLAFDSLKFENLITVSKALKKSYDASGFAKKVTVIPRGIPDHYIVSDFEPRGLDKRSIKLLYAGRVVPEKGAHIAIESLNYLYQSKQLKDQNVSLHIVGSGPDEYITDLKKLVSDYGLSEKIKFISAMTRDDLLKLYSEYDIMLMPAIWEEPFANTVLESMARNLPVIASRVGGIPELIEDGVTGILVPPDNINLLAEAIMKLISDPDLYGRLKAAGPQTVWQKYRQEVITDQIENHLLNSIHNHINF